MGESAGSASAWDLAFISYLFGAMLGFFHGARIFESEGLRVEDLGSMLANVAPVIGEMIKHEGEAIQTGNYGKPQSSLEMCADAVELIMKQAREAGINSEIPKFTGELFRKALSAGYGDEEVAALIKVLR
jgi:3-hydroxyisobutyrate dehydrogenase-like beta-hydroxyacid dehydrogenase